LGQLRFGCEQIDILILGLNDAASEIDGTFLVETPGFFV